MSNIYVSLFGYFGDYNELSKRLSKENNVNVTAYGPDKLCFTGLTGSQVSKIMENNGFDYEYYYGKESYSNAPDTLDIKVKFFQSQNYTPASAMHRWAMQNYETFDRTAYGEAYIRIYHRKYFYDSWKIEKLEDGKEEVTIHLVKKEG